jgi:hypothetical protein
MVMQSRRNTNRLAYAIAAGFALATASGLAAEAGKQQSAESEPAKLAEVRTPGSVSVQNRALSAMAFPPQQAGVRRAAAEGPTSLRRYVTRTQAIYGYSYRDFAKYLPPE